MCIDKKTVAIVDYKLGNIGSIFNMIKKLGFNPYIASKPCDIINAEKLILPGVGSFDAGMKNLIELNMISVLNEKVQEKKTPIMGICLGMQLMTSSSEEGSMSGLKWVDANTKKFNFIDNFSSLKIPHMGWNNAVFKDGNLLNNSYNEIKRYYFVHSYHVICNNEDDIIAYTEYGYRFVSAFQRENVIGVQFHPEKSHKYGMELMNAFLSL